MARSGARRKTKAQPKAKLPTRGGVSTRPATRHEYSHVEAAMFFPRLRRQAKWMFVFLVLVFGLGFVVFGVGSGGGLGLGDLIQGSGSSSSGPSVKDARKKIDNGDLTAYKALTEAYRAEGKTDEAIAAGEQYLKVKPKDYDFMRTLALDYSGKARRLRDEASAVQEDLTAKTGGTTFALPQNTTLGRALGIGKIDQELTTAANKTLTEQYSGIQTAYTRATQLYQQITVSQPKDVLLQLLLAQSAYQAQLVPTALKAYRQVIKLAPGSNEAIQAAQQIQQLKAQTRAATVPGG